MSRITGNQIEVQQAWQSISTFANSWVNYDPPTQHSVAYYKDSLGIVHLRGLIKNGTVGAVAFTLPAGYRPDLPYHFACASNNAAGVGRVDPNGTVNILAGSNIWFDVSVMSFKAEN